MTLTVPNCLTLFRIIVVPIIVLVYFLDIPYSNWVCLALFSLAGISDGLDGYLARKWNQSTKLGAFLDPVADKLLVVAMLVLVATNIELLQEVQVRWLFILTVLIIISREITVSALREWMAELGQRSNVAVSWIGKYKTGFQIGAIGFLLVKERALGLPVLLIGELLLYLAGLLTVWSMCIYLSAAYKTIENE